MSNTDISPVIDDIVESSTTSQELAAPVIEDDVAESDSVEEVSEASDEDISSDGQIEPEQEEKSNVQKRIDKITADKKEAERLLSERTEQFYSILSESGNLERRERANYSSDDSFDGAMMLYKMELAKSDQTKAKAYNLVKQTLSERLGDYAKSNTDKIKSLEGMPSEFFELLAFSKNPEKIVDALSDESKRNRLSRLPAHMLGQAIHDIDQSHVEHRKSNQPKEPLKNYKPISESKPASFKPSKIPSVDELVKRYREPGGKI